MVHGLWFIVYNYEGVCLRVDDVRFRVLGLCSSYTILGFAFRSSGFGFTAGIPAPHPSPPCRSFDHQPVDGQYPLPTRPPAPGTPPLRPPAQRHPPEDDLLPPLPPPADRCKNNYFTEGFRGGLAVKAHRFVSLNSRIESKIQEGTACRSRSSPPPPHVPRFHAARPTADQSG